MEKLWLGLAVILVSNICQITSKQSKRRCVHHRCFDNQKYFAIAIIYSGLTLLASSWIASKKRHDDVGAALWSLLFFKSNPKTCETTHKSLFARFFFSRNFQRSQRWFGRNTQKVIHYFTTIFSDISKVRIIGLVLSHEILLLAS